MLFNSLTFYVFLAITLLFYFTLTKSSSSNLHLIWLIATSLFFYAFWNPVYLPLIIGSIVFNFLLGRQLVKVGSKSNRGGRMLLWLGLLGNVGLLGYFKYADFFIANYNTVANSNIPLLHVVLPLGISFFTFTQIAFLVDASQGKIKECNFISYMLFVTFFPHLLAGPILHHAEMMPQFADATSSRINWKNIYAGLFLFAIGLFKQVVIADSLSESANAGFSHADSLEFFSAWHTTLSYTFQLYFDFSGYSDMALGIALMFNIRLPVNFNSPYAAMNLQNFWRRWHMTLSRFLRDYVYIPLGGNKVNGWRVYTNLFLTFLIGGIWHGAGWTFVVWGCIHGAGICIHRAWSHLNVKLPPFWAWLITFGFVHIAWVFFRANNLTDALIIARALFSPSKAIASGFPMPEMHVSMIGALCIFVFMIYESFIKNSVDLLDELSLTIKWSAATAALLVTSTFFMLNSRVSEFLYFQF